MNYFVLNKTIQEFGMQVRIAQAPHLEFRKDNILKTTIIFKPCLNKVQHRKSDDINIK